MISWLVVVLGRIAWPLKEPEPDLCARWRKVWAIPNQQIRERQG